MTQMLVEDGVKVIVPLIRNDVWGNDLLGATTSDFTGRGGVVATATRYDPKATDFSVQMAEADSRVAALLGTYAAGEIALYLCSFGEGTSILTAAGGFPNLDTVSWYGSSAFAQNGQLPTDAAAAGFALAHKLPCPIFGLDEADREKWQPLKMRIEATTGHNPDAYALTAYDAAWVGMKSYLAVGTSPSISALKKEFVRQAEIYDGVTGNTALDVNGDRAVGNYDFWGMKQQSGTFSWVVMARYNSATGVLTRFVQ
jgi:branched-chain amino acid transport system substrate-binding protein